MIRRRAFVALLAAIAFAGAQFMVSAHACDAFALEGQLPAAAHPVGCAGAAQDNAAGENICAQHCQYGHASFDSNPPAPLSMHVSGPLFRVAWAPDPVAACLVPAERAVLTIAKPPPTILFGVLRI